MTAIFQSVFFSFAPFLIYFLLFSFSSLLFGLAFLLGLGFDSFIPVTTSLFPSSFSHPPSFLIHSLHAPAYRAFSVFPIRIHLAVESAVLHSQVSWGWFAIHSSGYGFTSTSVDKERKSEAWKREAKGGQAIVLFLLSFSVPPSSFRHWDAAGGSQNTCLKAKGLEAAIQDGWGICVPLVLKGCCEYSRPPS